MDRGKCLPFLLILGIIEDFVLNKDISVGLIMVVWLLVFAVEVHISSSDPLSDPVTDVILQEVGKDVQLTCNVENKSEYSPVQWRWIPMDSNSMPIITLAFDNQVFDSSRWAVKKVSDTIWRLDILDVQLASQGKYQCLVQTSAHSYVSDERTLTVYSL